MFEPSVPAGASKEGEFSPLPAKYRPLPGPTDPPSANRARMIWPYGEDLEDQ